jgi:alpha-tubulin suppressor-like RCC1 family protein
MLVTDMGQVYAFGKDTFSEPEHGSSAVKNISAPRLVEALDGIFVVQIAIGNYFTAALSREGCVFTLCWGSDAKLGHASDTQDLKPHQLAGALENIPVVQIAAGFCYLLALAYHPCGM